MDNELLAQINTLLENASDEVRKLVLSGEIDSAMVPLTNTYHLTVTEAIAVKNTIILTLLGMVPTNKLHDTIKEETSLADDDLAHLIKDIDEGIFEKARVSLFGEEYEKGHEIRTLTLGEEENKTELREQILSHTERDPSLKSPPIVKEVSPQAPPADNSPILPKSRSELLERMSVLDAIPKNEEIEERLAKIQAQFQTKEEEEKREETPIIPAIEPIVPPKPKVIFPEEYEVDPYRELPQ